MYYFNIPHLAYDTIIYQIAISLKIPITIVTQSLFPDKFFSLEKLNVMVILMKQDHKKG